MFVNGITTQVPESYSSESPSCSVRNVACKCISIRPSVMMR